MNAKIERVNKDIAKTKEKVNEFQARLRELEKQKTELENIEIVDAVRGMDISFAELADLLKAARATSGQVGPKSRATKTTADIITEDNGDEEKEGTEE